MTVANYIDRAFVRLGIDPAALSQVERDELIEKLSKEANRVMLAIKLRGIKRVVICAQDQREYQLRDVQNIQGITINGCDITGLRVPQVQTFSDENRS
jgi:hypothetical protein